MTLSSKGDDGMNVKYKTVGDVVVVVAKGKLMGGPETNACHAKIKSLIAEGYKKVVVDMTHVDWVNSMGIGMMIACYTSCKNAGGHFKIAGPSEKTISILDMTRLSTVFKWYDNVEQAIASYEQ